MNRTASKRAALPLRLLWSLAAVLLLVSACGSDNAASGPTAAPATDATPSSEAPAATQAPTTTTGSAAAETADAPDEMPASVDETEDSEPEPAEPEYQYQRIVSISPTGTEILFAIGAGDRVVAVDEFSYYPPEAPVTDFSGRQPTVEAIPSYDPDLVVMGSDGDVEATL